jgi:hypothetical protein
MITLKLFFRDLDYIPAGTSWYLSDLAEARGRQELFTRQSPQRLKALREHALIESAISSNRIEGVEVDKSRIPTIVFGKSLLRNRDEEEVRGYREALDWIHKQGAKLPITERYHRELSRRPFENPFQDGSRGGHAGLHEGTGGALQRRCQGSKDSACRAHGGL